MENKTNTILSTNLAMPKELSSIYAEVDGLSLQNLFYAKYSIFPNCKMFIQYSKGGEKIFEPRKILDYLLENTPKEEEMEHIVYSTYNLTSKEENIGFCAVFNKSRVFVRVERNVSESYVLYETGKEAEVDKFIECLEKFYVEPQREKNNLWKIAQTQNGYMLIKSKVKVVENFNIQEQYNDSFEKENNKIEEFLSEKEKGGLVILHGEKGTGKSTYIRHLINEHDDLNFVFVPANLVPLLGDPSFGTFLQTLANHIVILEDCENAIRDRKVSGSSAAVSLLLNMTDGLLEDDLGIKFICTFNEDVKNIDPALTRKGRLVSKYEFTALCKEKTNILLDKLYSDENGNCPISDKAMTLADIYNFEDDSYEEKRKTII